MSSLSTPVRRLNLLRTSLHTLTLTSQSHSHSTTRLALPSYSTMPTPSNSRAPWRDLLASHLDRTPGYDFTVATVGYDSHNRPVPRVRTCGCRGFFPELKLHPSGQNAMEQQVEDGGNPDCYESDMLSFTTDIRMEKLPQLDASGHAIEAMFWLKDLMMQWRVKGRAFAIGRPFGEADNGERASREEICSGLRAKGDFGGDSKKWSWEKAVTKYFANHSPAMRGSFKVPPPGQPRSQAPSNPALGIGLEVTDLHDPVARENFRVVVIVPDEVELLDLSDQANVRRWKWMLAGSDDPNDDSSRKWLEIEVWP